MATEGGDSESEIVYNRLFKCWILISVVSNELAKRNRSWETDLEVDLHFYSFFVLFPFLKDRV